MMKRIARWTGIVIAILAACAALYYVLGREGLQPVVTLGLFGGWSIGIGWWAYRLGLDAGYRRSMELPPPEEMMQRFAPWNAEEYHNEPTDSMEAGATPDNPMDDTEGNAFFNFDGGIPGQNGQKQDD